MTLSAVLFPLLVCGTAFMINFIAIYYHASRAIPFATMVSWKSLTIDISAFSINTFSNTQVTGIFIVSNYVHVQLLVHVTVYAVMGRYM